MILKRNWINFSLEELEDGEPLSVHEDSSYLIKTATGLRRKKLIDFEIEDLRLMIGQNISLNYLMPLAIEKLREDVMVEGDYYEGDLLRNVLSVEKAFWQQNGKLKNEVKELVLLNHQYIESFETNKEFKQLLTTFLNS